jgi:hypothetical protein
VATTACRQHQQQQQCSRDLALSLSPERVGSLPGCTWLYLLLATHNALSRPASCVSCLLRLDATSSCWASCAKLAGTRSVPSGWHANRPAFHHSRPYHPALPPPCVVR